MQIVSLGQHQPSEHNTVTVAIVAMQQSRQVLLLLQRNPHAYDNAVDPFPCAWELLGGHVETGEEPTIAALREIEEETKLSPLSLELLGIMPFTSEGHANNWVYLATFEHAAPVVLSGEHLAYTWTPLQAAQQMELAYKHTPILQALLQRKGW